MDNTLVTLIAPIITVSASLITAGATIYVSIILAKSKEQLDLRITEINQKHQEQMEIVKSDLLRVEKIFSKKEASLILVYETIAEIFYYLECYLVPLTTNDIDRPKEKILSMVSVKFGKLRLISLQKELYIPTSAELGKRMANLMGYINRIQNNPTDWDTNAKILKDEFWEELKIFQDSIKKELKLD